MRRIGLVLAIVVAVAVGAPAPGARAADTGPEFREIRFPVEGAVSFSDDFGDPRSGGRTHAGNDLMGTRMQKLLAAVDGTVTTAKLDASNLSGHMLTIRDADGWTYRYIHLNNDSPGTDDGLATLEHVFAPGVVAGAKVAAGDHVAFMGDSGNAEDTSPHLHFEIHDPDGTAINPWTSLRLAKGMPAGTRCSYPKNPRAKASTASGAGYYVLGDDGGIFTFGAAPFVGSVPGLGLGTRVTALRLAATKSGHGYHVLGDDGGVFAFGDAAFHGSVPGLGLPVRVRALDLRPTSSGNGYWVLGDDGGVFSFGDAEFHGSVPGLGIPTTVVAMTAAPAPSRDTTPAHGYWVLGSDGGVFSFGVPFHGSIPGVGLCRWPKGVQMAPSATGMGYWVVAEDGSVWPFGDAVDHGDVPGIGLTTVRAVDLAVVPPTAAPTPSVATEAPSTTTATERSGRRTSS